MQCNVRSQPLSASFLGSNVKQWRVRRGREQLPGLYWLEKPAPRPAGIHYAVQTPAHFRDIDKNVKIKCCRREGRMLS